MTTYDLTAPYTKQELMALTTSSIPTTVAAARAKLAEIDAERAADEKFMRDMADARKSDRECAAAKAAEQSEWDGTSPLPQPDPTAAAEIARLQEELDRIAKERAAAEANAWNIGMEDPHDHYPWTWTPYLDADGGPIVGSIHTPNGKRPDGSMHTYWGVAHQMWEPIGRFICAVVNQWAHDHLGTPIGDHSVDIIDPAVRPAPGWDRSTATDDRVLFRVGGRDVVTVERLRGADDPGKSDRVGGRTVAVVTPHVNDGNGFVCVTVDWAAPSIGQATFSQYAPGTLVVLDG